MLALPSRLPLSRSPEEDHGMFNVLGRFWRDDRGCVEATGWMLVASILTLSAIAGMTALYQAGW